MKKNFVFGRFEDFHRLGHGRRIDPVLGIHEELARGFDRGARSFHFLHETLVHQRLAHVLADRRRIAGPAEIAGEWFLADHVLARGHRLDDHLRVQRRRRADIDDVDRRVGEQGEIVAMRLRDAVFLREVHDMVAARHHCRHLRIDAIDALERIHVQFGDKARADQADAYFRHCNSLRSVIARDIIGPDLAACCRMSSQG
jgi:hypothetical protein